MDSIARTQELTSYLPEAEQFSKHLTFYNLTSEEMARAFNGL